MSGLEDENRMLRNSTDVLRKQNEKLRSQLVFMGELLGAGDVKITAGRKSKLNSSMKPAVNTCRSIVIQRYWPKMKLLPKNWTVFSEEKNDFCRDVMVSMGSLIPEGWNKIIFWHVGIVPIVRETYNTLRSEKGQKLSSIALGELLLLCNVLPMKND